LPPWWGTCGWFFGVAIGGLVYHPLAMMRPRAQGQDVLRA
jgi:cytosine/uracil/thiamine/allantoin permease